MDTTHLVSYLPFDASPTDDWCGNSWTTYGSPTVGTSGAISGKALQLNGSSYLKRDSNFVFTGQPFTIGCRFSGTTRPSSGEVCIWQLYNGIASRIQMGFPSSGRLYLWKDSDSTVYLQTASNVFDGQNHYAEMDFDGSTWYFFVDGVLIGKKAHRPSAVSYTLYVGINYQTSKYFTGSVDEFQIYDGVALHTENFTPPTALDYADQQIALTTYDIQRTVKNAALTWRYENAGDADDLTLTAPILRDLPATKSKFGVAFYQTTRAKCFDLPATHEVWMKFDVYFDGSNRWRAFNGAGNDFSYNAGITAQTNGNLSFVNLSTIQVNFTGVCKTNTLQTVLLHMISGASDGFVEAWVDGNFIHRYTGNVNQGNDFADIYLQSDGSGTFFSNVIISNAPIGLDEDVKLGDIVTCDIQRRLANVVTTTADLQRRVINPATVTADLQRRVVKSVTITADLQRRLLDPTVTVTCDIQRRLLNAVAVTADTQRRVIRSESLTVDVQRRVTKAERTSFDIQRRITNNVVVTFDLQRRLANVETVTFDLQRKIIGNAIIKFDLQRRIIMPEVVARMLSRISPVYDDSAFMQSFFQAIGVEWTKIRNYFLTLREQRFIKTVDWGIEYLEHKYSVVPDRTLTLEERRARLGIKAFQKYPLNPAVLERLAREIFGLDVYLDEKMAGYIWIIATELSKEGYEGFLKFLLREKPAHLALAFMLYSPEYIGGKDGDFPKLHAGLVEIDSGSETIALPKPKNMRADLYAGAMQVSHGTAKIGLPKPKSHLIKIWAGGVVLVSGTISIG